MKSSQDLMDYLRAEAQLWGADDNVEGCENPGLALAARIAIKQRGLREEHKKVMEILGQAWHISFGIDDMPDIAAMPEGGWSASNDGIGFGERYPGPIEAWEAHKPK